MVLAITAADVLDTANWRVPRRCQQIACLSLGAAMGLPHKGGVDVLGRTSRCGLGSFFNVHELHVDAESGRWRSAEGTVDC